MACTFDYEGEKVSGRPGAAVLAAAELSRWSATQRGSSLWLAQRILA
jgi:hypothetical protein